MLKLRLRQLWRYMQEIGAFRVGILLLAAIIFLPRLAIELWLNNPYYLAMFWGVILLSIHLKRPDITFLQRLGIPWRILFIIEYGTISIPFILLFFFQHYEWVSLSLIAEVLVLPWLPQWSVRFKTNKRSYWWHVHTLWSPLHFEWVSGIRKRFVTIAILWLLGIVFCAFAPVVPIVNLLLTITIAQFYFQCEPKEMVEAMKLSPRQFIRWKVWQNLRLFGLMTLPLWVGFLIFNSQYWFALPTVWFIAALLLALAVLFKYASYAPNEDLSQNNTLMALAIMFLFMQPFSFLINVFWIIRYYGRAIRNMKFYLKY